MLFKHNNQHPSSLVETMHHVVEGEAIKMKADELDKKLRLFSEDLQLARFDRSNDVAHQKIVSRMLFSF